MGRFDVMTMVDISEHDYSDEGIVMENNNVGFLGISEMISIRNIILDAAHKFVLISMHQHVYLAGKCYCQICHFLIV